MQRTEINVQTGEITIVDLTPEEVTAAEAYAATIPPYVPQVISDRQFFQQAAVAGIITQAEAIAAVQTGTIPSMLQTIIDGLPDADQKFAATMLLAGATQFERNHPLTVAVGAHLGLTTAQVDDFFIAAAQL